MAINKSGNRVVLRFKNVSKTYSKDGSKALSDVNLDIIKGEFVFLTGPSGSGKTTFLKLLYKAEENEKGSIFFNGKNIKSINKRYLRRKLGIVFQDYQLLLNKTVLENVKYPLECIGVRPRIAEFEALKAIEKMRIMELKNKYPNELSGGQQQRVAIARAIVNNPDFLICDEPTGNLDNENAFSIMEHLKELNDNGTTVIMSTHNEEILTRESDKRVISLDRGKIISDTDALIKKDEDDFEKETQSLVMMLRGGE